MLRNLGSRCHPHWGLLSSQLSLSEICIMVVFFAGSQQDPISVQSYRTSVSIFPPTLYFRMSSFLDTASISSFTIFQLLPFHDNLALPWLVLFQSRRLGFFSVVSFSFWASSSSRNDPRVRSSALRAYSSFAAVQKLNVAQAALAWSAEDVRT